MSESSDNLIHSLTTLNRIAETLNRAVNVKAALDTALVHLLELMRLETGWIFLKDPTAKSQWAGRGYTLAAHRNLPPAMAPNKAGAWKGGCDCQGLCNKGQLTAAYNEVRCTRLASVKAGDRRGLTVHASTPLRSGDQVLGILNVAAPDWDSFSPESLALLTNVGNQMGIALERARLYDLLQERHIEEQAAVLEFTSQLLGHPQLDQLVQSLVQEVHRLLDVDACALVMPGDQPGTLVYTAASGWRMDPVAHHRQLPDDENNGPSLAIRTQLPIVAEDLTEDPLAAYMPGWLRAEEFRGHAVLPLVAENRAIGALVIDNRRPRLLDEDEMRFVRLMANQAAIAIEGVRLQQEELKRQRLVEELTVARQIQRSMLPKFLPQYPGWEFAAAYEAARLVGGDFYDYFELPGQPLRLGIVIADVADKGVPAALFMAMSRTLIRSTAFSGRGPAAALMRANELILKDSQTDMFLSAVYGVLDLANGRLVYANAGHNRPLLLHAARAGAGAIEELPAKGTILGVFEDITVEERQVSLAPGDVVVFYTDGITEAMNASLELFGTERLRQALHEHRGGTASDLLEAVLDASRRFTNDQEQSDDTTLFVVRRLPSQETSL